jgi:hypothetical protein
MAELALARSAETHAFFQLLFFFRVRTSRSLSRTDKLVSGARCWPPSPTQ